MKIFRNILLVAVIFALPSLAFADAPIQGRAGRAEVRFMQGMIDHHQMALDMANHCLEHATTDDVRDICGAVIAAQTPEIEQMQTWLADWYGIAYTPMSMLGGDHDEHAEHDAAASAPPMGGMGMGMGMDMPMMGMGMMDGMNMMGMQGMMMQMHQMMMMMHMQTMMMQMQGMMGMDMDAMMQGMMGQMQGMMGMMGGMGQSGANQGEHSEHHPEGDTAVPGDHSQHSGDAAQGDHSQHEGAGLSTDPSMTMGMMAGLDRAEGIDYDITWLESMIDHHDDAIHMAERILEQAEHPELIALAQAIITVQTAENAQMEALIETLGS